MSQKKVPVKRIGAGLPHSRRMAIAKWKEKHPEDSTRIIADRFDVTTEQVRNAVRQYQAGTLHKTPRRQPRKRASEVKESLSADEIFQDQYHTSLASLAASKEIPVDERIKHLGSLAFIRKTISQISLQAHLKRVDAEVIVALVHRFDASLTEQEIIKIYMECLHMVQTRDAGS
jgi:transposase-like protein